MIQGRWNLQLERRRIPPRELDRVVIDHVVQGVFASVQPWCLHESARAADRSRELICSRTIQPLSVTARHHAGGQRFTWLAADAAFSIVIRLRPARGSIRRATLWRAGACAACPAQSPGPRRRSSPQGSFPTSDPDRNPGPTGTDELQRDGRDPRGASAMPTASRDLDSRCSTTHDSHIPRRAHRNQTSPHIRRRQLRRSPSRRTERVASTQEDVFRRSVILGKPPMSTPQPPSSRNFSQSR